MCRVKMRNVVDGVDFGICPSRSCDFSVFLKQHRQGSGKFLLDRRGVDLLLPAVQGRTVIG